MAEELFQTSSTKIIIHANISKILRKSGKNLNTIERKIIRIVILYQLTATI
jgi:transcription termination factor NusB